LSPIADLVPLIDLSRWPRGRAAERRAIAAALDEAASRIGFFQITGHGIPDDVLERMQAATARFFAPNLWPAGLPELRPALTAYFDAAVDIGMMLTDVFALALGLSE
jgi:isopenicillin N synthase-like dioxygenase